MDNVGQQPVRCAMLTLTVIRVRAGKASAVVQMGAKEERRATQTATAAQVQAPAGPVCAWPGMATIARQMPCVRAKRAMAITVVRPRLCG
mgnify:CR=1 FL=1